MKNYLCLSIPVILCSLVNICGILFITFFFSGTYHTDVGWPIILCYGLVVLVTVMMFYFLSMMNVSWDDIGDVVKEDV